MTRFSKFAFGLSAIALMAADGAEGAAPDAATVANGATLAPLTDETKVTAIKKALVASRKTYANLADALAALTTADGATDHFYGLPVGIVGYDTTSDEVDSAIYEGMSAVLGWVGSKGDEAKGKASGVKAIVLYPMPTVESFLASDKGKEWIAKVAEKEVGLVAFRNFRDAATLEEFQAGIAKTPKTVDEYVAEHARGAAGVDTETFDATWPGLRIYLKNKQPLLHKALPTKPEVIKAIRSAAYAVAEYPKLEEAGVFVRLAQTCIGAAKSNVDEKTKVANPLPTDSIESWIANRDSVTITKQQRAEVDIDKALEQFGAWAQ